MKPPHSLTCSRFPIDANMITAIACAAFRIFTIYKRAFIIILNNFNFFLVHITMTTHTPYSRNSLARGIHKLKYHAKCSIFAEWQKTFAAILRRVSSRDRPSAKRELRDHLFISNSSTTSRHRRSHTTCRSWSSYVLTVPRHPMPKSSTADHADTRPRSDRDLRERAP